MLSTAQDLFRVQRAAPGSANATVLLTLDNAGRLTTASSLIIGGTAATKWRLSDVGSGDFQLRYNQDPITNTADNAGQASWAMRLGSADDFALFRAPVGSPTSFTQQFQVRGSDGKTVCSLANASVTLPMLGARSTLANLAAGSVPVNFSCAAGAWTRLATTSAFTARGSLVLLWLSCGLFYGGAAGSDVYVNMQSTQGGGWAVRALAGAGQTVWVPFASSVMAVFWLSAGAVTFYADVFTSAGSLATRDNSSGYLHALEFA
jgi:hypothetical protein